MFLGGPMRFAEGVESNSESGRACGVPFAGLDPHERRRVYYYSLFPTMFLSPHPDYVLVHRIERLGVAQTRVVCELLFPPEAVARPDFDPTPAVNFWDETNRQDWRVCELSQQGVSSAAYAPGPFSNLESIVAAFDAHYLQVLGHETT
jgi:Rieske 2Fe-2S family protein